MAWVVLAVALGGGVATYAETQDRDLSFSVAEFVVVAGASVRTGRDEDDE